MIKALKDVGGLYLIYKGAGDMFVPKYTMSRDNDGALLAVEHPPGFIRMVTGIAKIATGVAVLNS